MAAGRRGTQGGNAKLLAARLRQPSSARPGEPMSTQEVAQAINEYLWTERDLITSVDHRFVSNYEAGTRWWPSQHYREAFRHVLQVERDADLGFKVRRGVSAAQASDPQVLTAPHGLATGASLIQDAARRRATAAQIASAALIAASAPLAKVAPDQPWYGYQHAQESEVMSDDMRRRTLTTWGVTAAVAAWLGDDELTRLAQVHAAPWRVDQVVDGPAKADRDG